MLLSQVVRLRQRRDVKRLGGGGTLFENMDKSFRNMCIDVMCVFGRSDFVRVYFGKTVLATMLESERAKDFCFGIQKRFCNSEDEYLHPNS